MAAAGRIWMLNDGLCPGRSVRLSRGESGAHVSGMGKFFLRFESGEPRGKGLVDESVSVRAQGKAPRRWTLVRRRDNRQRDFAWVPAKHTDARRRNHASEVPGCGFVVHIHRFAEDRTRRPEIGTGCAWF